MRTSWPLVASRARGIDLSGLSALLGRVAPMGRSYKRKLPGAYRCRVEMRAHPKALRRLRISGK
jgi:hypothetical protein